MFFNAFERTFAEILTIAFVGPNRLSFTYWENAHILIPALTQMLKKDPWVTAYFNLRANRSNIKITGIIGYGAYGLLAKGLAARMNCHGYAFRSSQLDESLVSVYQGWEKEDQDKMEGRVEHFSSGSSLLFPSTATSTSDFHALPSKPGLKTFFHSPRTVETFCLIAAGCATTDKYDYFCERVLGSKKMFDDMFELWGRTNRSFTGTKSNLS